MGLGQLLLSESRSPAPAGASAPHPTELSSTPSGRSRCWSSGRRPCTQPRGQRLVPAWKAASTRQEAAGHRNKDTAQKAPKEATVLSNVDLAERLAALAKPAPAATAATAVAAPKSEADYDSHDTDDAGSDNAETRSALGLRLVQETTSARNSSPEPEGPVTKRVVRRACHKLRRLCEIAGSQFGWAARWAGRIASAETSLQTRRKSWGRSQAGGRPRRRRHSNSGRASRTSGLQQRPRRVCGLMRTPCGSKLLQRTRKRIGKTPRKSGR